MPLQIRMPDGSFQYFNDIDEALNQKIQAGGEIIDPTTGQAYQTQQAYGGTLYNGQPLNYQLNQTYLPGQTDALEEMGGTPGPLQPGSPGYVPPPPDPPEEGGGNGYSINDFTRLSGLGGAAPVIPNINLPNTPQISTTFGNDVTDTWQQLIQQGQGQAGNPYDLLTTPTMNASQMNMSDVPRVQDPSSMAHLLSGQGFNPEIMARLRAGVIDDTAMAGRSNAGAARLAAEQAGLGQSPAGLAMVAQANRQQGDATTRGLNQVEIENAGRGLENYRLGAGMQYQGALQNAQNLFAGLQQNVANVQQANQTNTGYQQQQNMEKAGAQSGLSNNMVSNYGSALLNKASAAEGQNVSNEINRGLNQAQLARQRDMYNTSTGENRYSQAFGGVLGLINGTNPFTYNISGANMGQQPNYGYANMFQNTGNQFLNQNQG
jgi:hypothetical protein